MGAQLAVVGALGVVGWQALHPARPSGGVAIGQADPGAVPPPGPGASVGTARVPASPPATATRPVLSEIVARVNRDDARLYRSQWASLQLVVQATGRYLVQQVMPLLLAAAHGGTR